MIRVAAMLALIRVPLRQHQREALAAFCRWLAGRYGDGAVTVWERSAMLRMINDGHTLAVGNELLNWVYTGGVVDNALVKLRVVERMRWEGRYDDNRADRDRGRRAVDAADGTGEEMTRMSAEKLTEVER